MSDRKDMIIETNVPYARDPFVLLDNGVYYMYVTGWKCYKNTSGRLDGEWKELETFRVEDPEGELPNARGHRWAPEVYKYRGAYYMFTTYKIENYEQYGKRGCAVFRADSPEGPFSQISDGVVTPREFSALDGTLYVDGDGQPWMVYCKEWVSAPEGVGRMCIAKLSSDLSRFITEPQEIFTAKDPEWSRGVITDGCFMYKTEDGQLLMIWSNNTEGGYCVGIARSASGRIDGEWTQDRELLFSKEISGEYNGGHGMIFADTDGQMYLSIHSPNGKVGERNSIPVFVPLVEKNGTLVWGREGK